MSELFEQIDLLYLILLVSEAPIRPMIELQRFFLLTLGVRL